MGEPQLVLDGGGGELPCLAAEGGGRPKRGALLTQTLRPLAAAGTGLMSGHRCLDEGRLEEAPA